MLLERKDGACREEEVGGLALSPLAFLRGPAPGLAAATAMGSFTGAAGSLVVVVGPEVEVEGSWAGD